MSEPYDGAPEATRSVPPAGGPPPPPPAPAPGWGPGYGQAPGYGPPQYGQPQYGQPQYGNGPGLPPGYRAPVVQRGVVPLRPLSLGEIFDGAFRSVRANPRVMFGLSAVVVTAAVLVQTVIQWYSFGSIGDILSAPVDEQSDAVLGDMVGMLGGVLVSTVVSLISTTILTGLLIISVSRSVIGQRISLGDAWARAKPQIWRLLLLTLVILLLTAVVPALWAGAMVAAAVSEQWGLLAGIGFVGFVGVLAWLVWISTRTMLATPALMLEDQKLVPAFRRGWALSAGSFWRLFGIALLAALIVGLVASLITGPVSMITGVIAGSTGQDPFTSPLILALNAVATILATVLTTPFMSAVVALLYIDVRMRKEGLDVELGRAAEADPVSGSQV